jgi:hypothetical protein
MKPGYTESKTPANNPPIEKVSGGFRDGQNPGAEFGKGFVADRAAAKRAADAVRQRSDELSRRTK